jgi:hypothetical protein
MQKWQDYWATDFRFGSNSDLGPRPSKVRSTLNSRRRKTAALPLWPQAAILAAVRRFRLPPTADLQRPQIARWYLDKKPSSPSASSPRFAAATSAVAYLERESIGLPPSGVVAANDDDMRNPTARCVLYRIETLLRDNTSMITASTATNRRRSTPSGFEAALSLAATEASARACARPESAASEAVTPWAGSARKSSPARALSLPGSP